MKILEILRRHEVTVDGITQTMDLAPATVRRHLDILQRDGLVQVRPVRRETGRPHYAFALTQLGADAFPQHYIRVTGRLMDEIISLQPDDTSGRSGRDLAELVFDRMVDRIAQACEPRITASDVHGRLRQALAALADEGLAFEAEQQDGRFTLTGHECPCRRFADKYNDACRHDERLLSRLLALPVERMSVAAGTECTYRVDVCAVDTL